MNNYTSDLQQKLNHMAGERQGLKDKLSELRKKNVNPSNAEIASLLGLPNSISNLDNVDDSVLVEVAEMQRRANNWNKKYGGQIVDGGTIANLADHTVEDIYVRDIEKYNSVAIEYHYGIFINIDFEKIELGETLSDTRVRINKIELLKGAVNNKL
ncbi:hypothetical protein [Vibrio vulnificus]|uniref:hypothetical protein n=1 Tax=Vibrio vulnificus TaxID=672 RepID=UPI003D9C8994